MRLDRRSAELGVRMRRAVAAKRQTVERLRVQLEERSPLRLLERGYAICYDAAGNVVQAADGVADRRSYSRAAFARPAGRRSKREGSAGTGNAGRGARDKASRATGRQENEGMKARANRPRSWPPSAPPETPLEECPRGRRASCAVCLLFVSPAACVCAKCRRRSIWPERFCVWG